MLKLGENEKVVLTIRKHWFVMARTVVLFILLILAAPLILTFLPLLAPEANPAAIDAIVNFGLSLYIMAVLAFLFLAWMDYYLDMWIITTARIIDIEQQGLFSREISEIPLSSVEDVTIEIRGVVETLLKFGTIRVQTAGKGEFTITYAPHLYEAKDVILKYAAESKKLNY